MKARTIVYGLLLLVSSCRSAVPAPQGARVSTLSGNGVSGFNDGDSRTAQFKEPSGITLDAQGVLYIADTNNGRIRKINQNNTVSTLAGNNNFGLVDGLGSLAQFAEPHGVAVDNQGNVYVTDTGNSRIRKITPVGQVSTFAGSGYGGLADGPGARAQFSRPNGIAIDKQNNLYIADTENHCIRKISPQGEVSTLAGGTKGFADGKGTVARFFLPYSLTIDDNGSVYVADYGNHRIRAITPDGQVSTIAGSGQPGFADGAGISAQFDAPCAITISNKGNIYVCDNSNRIRHISPNGQVVTIAGTGIRGFEDGAASTAQFNLPQSLATDANGSLYIADGANQRIRKVTFD